jgi:hypothetical protein
MAMVVLALVTQWVPVIRDNVNYGLSVINVEAHAELTFCDSIFVFCLVFLVETSVTLQMVLGNIVVRNLGNLAPGIYLLAPSILYSIVPDVATSMNASTITSSSSVLGVSWVVLFIVCHALALVFYFAVEIPSYVAAEWWADAAMSGTFAGTGRRISHSDLLSMKAASARAGIESEPKSSVIA